MNKIFKCICKKKKDSKNASKMVEIGFHSMVCITRGVEMNIIIFPDFVRLMQIQLHVYTLQ